MTSKIPEHDVDILRRLAERKAQIAQDPVNLERRDAWYRLDAGTAPRPMVLAEVGGIRDHLLPLPDSLLQCTDPWARSIEKGLQVEIWQFDELRDDHVVEPWMQSGWSVQVSDYGVTPTTHQPQGVERLGARRWDPPLQDLERDLHLLKPRSYAVDREATQVALERLREVFSPVLPVRLRGGFWWTLGMTWTVIELIGLEQLMLAMFDAPAALHRLMAFLRDEALRYTEWLEQQGLLCLNNENDYIGSGSMGYSRDLPLPGAVQRVGTTDQWVLLESQETVGVGPEQFAEFVFPYQEAIAKRFGKVYYGCCEPVHTRMHLLTQLDNLARVSVSPWTDEERMAAALGDRIVYSRKPNPTMISTPVFDEAAIRVDLRHTLEVANACRLELIMKDVHTLNEQPQRLARWVELARQEIDGVHG
jgi:hypothetical protein